MTATSTIKARGVVDSSMQTEETIRDRIEALRDEYDSHDPPSTEMEDEAEVAILRAIEELEWVLDERDADEGFTT